MAILVKIHLIRLLNLKRVPLFLSHLRQCHQIARQVAIQTVAQILCSSEASTSSQTAASDLDGTYKATHEGDTLTLEVSGNKGTLTKVERDGEQEIEQVQVDPTNQTMIVGDDVKRYRVEGKQLTLEDLSQKNDDDAQSLHQAINSKGISYKRLDRCSSFLCVWIMEC